MPTTSAVEAYADLLELHREDTARGGCATCDAENYVTRAEFPCETRKLLNKLYGVIVRGEAEE